MIINNDNELLVSRHRRELTCALFECWGDRRSHPSENHNELRRTITATYGLQADVVQPVAILGINGL